MTVKETLNCARKLLDASHIDDASLEGELLFRQAIGLNRAQLYSTLEHEIDPEQEAAFWQMVEDSDEWLKTRRWRVYFEWLLNNRLDVLEGKYLSKKPKVDKRPDCVPRP